MAREFPAEANFACDADHELETGFNGRYVASLLDRLGEVEVEMHLGEIGFARFVASNSDDEHVVGATRIEPYQPVKELSDG